MIDGPRSPAGARAPRPADHEARPSGPRLAPARLTRRREEWRSVPSEPGLWLRADGLIVNDAALAEREAWFRVVRLPAGA